MIDLGRQELIYRLLSSISVQFEYAVLHHANEVFSTDRDIDIVINCSKLQLLKVIKNAARELDLRISNFFPIDKATHRVDLTGVSSQGEIQSIELDCLTNDGRGLLIDFNLQKVFAEARTEVVNGQAIRVVSRHAEVDYYIAKKAYKRELIDLHCAYIQSVDPTISNAEIACQYKHEVRGFRSFQRRLMRLGDRLFTASARLNMKPGLSIAILGPDGAGKSTLINGLAKESIFGKFNYFHLKPAIVKSAAPPIANPQAAAPYGPLKSHAKLIYLMFSYVIGWLKNVFPLSLGYNLIVFDRYYHDIFVDPLRFRYGGSQIVARFFGWFIPKPNLFFVLITDPAVAHERKAELTFQELYRQNKEYSKLLDHPQFYQLDGSKPLNQLVRDIVTIISDYKHARY